MGSEAVRIFKQYIVSSYCESSTCSLKSEVGAGYVKLACKQICFDFAARDEQRGLEAVKQLNSEGLSPKFHQLDISSTESIEKLKTFLQEHYGGLDILVNNAGIAYKVGFVFTSIYKA